MINQIVLTLIIALGLAYILIRSRALRSQGWKISIFVGVTQGRGSAC